jgi:hypothetical protein
MMSREEILRRLALADEPGIQVTRTRCSMRLKLVLLSGWGIIETACSWLAATRIRSEAMNASEHQILWRGIYRPGHEFARLNKMATGWQFDGVAVFLDGVDSCRLDYLIQCGPSWETEQAWVRGWVGNQHYDCRIEVGADRQWRMNGEVCPIVGGCIDIDLNFSPVTNLLPLRRCEPRVGEEITVRAAWLRFPGFTLEPLEQSYRRTSESRYVYTSGGGAFTAELTVDDLGFVVAYEGGWIRA